MSKKINLVGKKFGKLIVLCDTGERRFGSIIWKCRCNCGNIKDIDGSSLRKKITFSCGCLQKESLKNVHKNNIKHDKSNKSDLTYNSWQAMKQRCLNKNSPCYSNWGGRGIKVCERWMKFENFIEDMGERPSIYYSIDRIDNDGNYEPENCKWSTRNEQARNKRNNKLDEERVKKIRKLLNEGNLSKKEIAKIFRVSSSIISSINYNKMWEDYE